jgi:hypothetical protein
MDQSVKLILDKGESPSAKTGREFRQGFCLSPILFNLYSEYFTKEAPEWSGGFKGGGQVICTVKFADNFELMVKEETCDRA